MTPEMWQALKDYLAERIDVDHKAAAASYYRGEGRAASKTLRAAVSENRSTLAKMAELEAGR